MCSNAFGDMVVVWRLLLGHGCGYCLLVLLIVSLSMLGHCYLTFGCCLLFCRCSVLEEELGMLFYCL